MQQRSLGAWESGFRSAHDMLCGTMLVGCKARIKGHYQFQQIKQAFQLLFSRHPLLQATIETRGYNAFFVLNADFANIPLQELHHITNWQSIFETELHQSLVTDKYLWRVTILKNEDSFDLILILHHAIADALSALGIIQQFMQIYQDLLNNIKPETQVFSLMPNIEQCLRETHDWLQFNKNYLELDQSSIDKIPYENSASIAERISKSIFITLDSSQLTKMLDGCKQHGVTLNSLLNAAMLITQAKLNPQYQHASLKTPVNLRQYAEPKISPEHIGCFLSIVETIHHYDSSHLELWSCAQHFQQQLAEAIPKIGFLPRTIDYAEVDVVLMSQLFGVSNTRRRNYLPNTFGVSNIGKIIVETQYSQFDWQDFIFTTNHRIGNYYMFVSAVTFNDQLQLIFSYVDPLMSRETAERFVSEYLVNFIN